jgi:hypothetical protein
MAAPEQDFPPFALEDLLETGRVNGEALQVTIAFTRAHPHLRWWFHHPGEDSAHDEVARQWRRHHAVVRATPHKHRRAEKYLEFLLDTAEEFILSEDQWLAAAYRHATSSEAWGKLPRSARDLYDALHAKAAESGRLGGPNVLMAHRVAIAMIEQATGHRYKLSNITYAREALISAGVITATVGEPWQQGVKSKGTVYHLLPASKAFELCPCPQIGIVLKAGGLSRTTNDHETNDHEPGTPRDTRPRWTDRDRDVFGEVTYALAENRAVAEWAKRPPRSFPVPPVRPVPPFEVFPDFEDLTPAWPGVGQEPASFGQAMAVPAGDEELHPAPFGDLIEGGRHDGSGTADAAAAERC